MGSLRLVWPPEVSGQREVLNTYTFAFCGFRCPGERTLSVIAFCKSLEMPLVPFVCAHSPTSSPFTVKTRWEWDHAARVLHFPGAVFFPIKKSISSRWPPLLAKLLNLWRWVLSKIPACFSFLESSINLVSLLWTTAICYYGLEWGQFQMIWLSFLKQDENLRNDILKWKYTVFFLGSCDHRESLIWWRMRCNL